MSFKPVFPTVVHQHAAEIVKDYFFSVSNVDSILVVNSCARGNAVPESDLDFAILVKPNSSIEEIRNIETNWFNYSSTQPVLLEYKGSSPFTHLHVDIINGNYAPAIPEMGGPLDYFEIEIGNQICYSAVLEMPGPYFRELQGKWLPYYGDELRFRRLSAVKKACYYNLDHLPIFIKRELYFHAFDTLCKAFQEYFQALFITHRIYPIAYNKWIKEQITKWLNKPALYPFLPPILSISNIESNEIIIKAGLLRKLLDDLNNEQ